MHAVKARQGWSKSDLANEFGIDRRRVDKLLDGVEARGDLHRGNPTYYIADVAYVLGSYSAKSAASDSPIDGRIGMGSGEVSPDDLDPKSRKEWYDGEKVRKGMLRDDLKLIPVTEVHERLSDVFKTIKAFLLTLGDVLERDAGLPAASVARVIKICDKLCDKLANQLVGHDVR